MEAVQRKIELQSPEDLAYLLGNVRRAATARLDEAFPPVEGGGEDELRNRIAELFIDQTFTLASPNMSINGLPVPQSVLQEEQIKEVEYEAFDGRKRRRVADLVAEEEKLLEEVAALKRTVPAAVASANASRLKEEMGRDDAVLKHHLARVRAELEAREDDVLPLPCEDASRQMHVEASFRSAVDTLARLKRDLPAVVAKMERARVAGEYVLGDKR
ncbi:hypothetical protein L249_0144 [Ophiocordyceps polyrhachis-furcata BCC 54312]|uniref:Kinetochore protein mis14 n=1 Tax=Ophiocordyceps polyrhachis-furcata BCC 54312 TaxID=1330021 RepID=A0A367LDR0_9HYPO|nr:hypothetical protein L249_0144 [Ophiocordyceps polyrhachis-furcata BCC 54312]